MQTMNISKWKLILNIFVFKSSFQRGLDTIRTEQRKCWRDNSGIEQTGILPFGTALAGVPRLSFATMPGKADYLAALALKVLIQCLDEHQEAFHSCFDHDIIVGIYPFLNVDLNAHLSVTAVRLLENLFDAGQPISDRMKFDKLFLTRIQDCIVYGRQELCYAAAKLILAAWKYPKHQFILKSNLLPIVVKMVTNNPPNTLRSHVCKSSTIPNSNCWNFEILIKLIILQ